MSLKSTTLGDALEDAIVFVDGDWVESKDQDPNGDIRLIQLADIGDGDFINKSLRFLTTAKAKELKCTLLEEGDILIARMPDPLGRACIFPGLNQKCVTVVDVCIVRVNPKKIHNRYLMHALNSNDVRREIERLATGTTRQRISRGNLKTVEIPLPPLEEQKRIADILDKAEALRAKRREAISLINSLTQSIFLEMFGDPVTNQKKWNETLRLDQVAEVSSGITKGRNVKGKATREIPYMAVLNVQDKRLDLTTIKTIAATEEEIEKYKLLENDLLLTEGGDPDKLGRGSLWQNNLPEAIHQNHIFKVRIKDLNKVNPIFLNWLVGSLRGKKYFLKSAKQTTGIATINSTQLKAFPLLLPPIDLQHQFASRVEKIHQTEQTLLQHHGLMENAFASIQQKAFSGQL
ncbi:restriction endonuclease subunit S [Bdellovibrio bacteriovorus]|uniref:restriction endonuclease subunit S n=1 Tax=Bdellovibrio bacteriovorus TaxID=959 RepID=UPI0035A686D7